MPAFVTLKFLIQERFDTVIPKDNTDLVFVMCEVPSSRETLNTDTDTFLTAQGITCYIACSQDCVKVNPDTHTGLCAPRRAALI